MIAYDYTVLPIYTGNTFFTYPEDDIESKLTFLGNDGWELCGVLPAQNNKSLLIFKRQKGADRIREIELVQNLLKEL